MIPLRHVNPYAAREAEERQAETDRLLAQEREFHERHRNEEASRVEGEKATARVALIGRVFDAASKRGLSFTNPPHVGSGWASDAVFAVNGRVADFAQQKFFDLVQAEEEVDAARRYLAGTSPSPITVGFPVEFRDLSHARSVAEIALARFEAAYEALEKRRALLADPVFIERIEQLNAIAEEAFVTPYAWSGMPEEQIITDALRSILGVLSTLRARQEAAMRKNAEGVILARQLGIMELPDQRGRLGPDIGANVVARTMAETAREWRNRTGWFGGDIERYFPDWKSPYA